MAVFGGIKQWCLAAQGNEGERMVLRRLSVWVVGDLGRLGHLDLDGLGLVLLDLGLLGLGLLGLSPLGLGGGGGGGGGGYRHMFNIHSLI